MASGSGSTRRRPMGFFAPFNTWWSQFFNRHNRRPSKHDIETWRAENLSWRPELTVDDIVQHSKGRRDPEKNRLYFVQYRRKLKADAKNNQRKNMKKVRGHIRHVTAGEDAYLQPGAEDDQDEVTRDEQDKKRDSTLYLRASQAYQARNSAYRARRISYTFGSDHSQQPTSPSAFGTDYWAAPSTGQYPGGSGCSSLVRYGRSPLPMSTDAPSDSPPLSPMGSRPTPTSFCAATTAGLPIFIPLLRARGPPLRPTSAHPELPALSRRIGYADEDEDGVANGQSCSYETDDDNMESVPENGPLDGPAAAARYCGRLASRKSAWPVEDPQTQNTTYPHDSGTSRNAADPDFWGSASAWPCESDQKRHPASLTHWMPEEESAPNLPPTTAAAALAMSPLASYAAETLRRCVSRSAAQGPSRQSPSQRLDGNNILGADSINSVNGIVAVGKTPGHAAIGSKRTPSPHVIVKEEIETPLVLVKEEQETLDGGMPMPGPQCDSPWSVLHCDGLSVGSGVEGDGSGCDGSDSGSPTPPDADLACKLTLSALRTSKRRPSYGAPEGQSLAQQLRRAEATGGLFEAHAGCPAVHPFTVTLNAVPCYVHAGLPSRDAGMHPQGRAGQPQLLGAEGAAALSGGAQQWPQWRLQVQKPVDLSGSHGMQNLGADVLDPELETLDSSWLDSLLDESSLPADCCFVQQGVISQQQQQPYHQSLHVPRGGPMGEPLAGGQEGLGVKGGGGGGGYGTFLDTLHEAWEAMLHEGSNAGESNAGAYNSGLGGWM